MEKGVTVWQYSPDTKVLVVDEVSHSCNLVSLIQPDNVDVRAEVFHTRLE